MKYALLCLLLIGCAISHYPTQSELAAADCGTYPENVKAIVEKYIAENFFDPHSVTDLEVKDAQKAYVADYNTNTWVYGWAIPFRCNAKNRMGGYTGLSITVLLYRNGEVSDVTNRVGKKF